MITLKTTHLRIRANRINTILTATNAQMGVPISEQLETVAKWADSASRTILHSTEKPTNHPGLRLSLTGNGNIPVASILRAYVVQIPGNEVFAIAAPNVLISQEQAEFFDYVDKQKMERAWAAYATGGGSVPHVFIMTAPVLPHILRDIPNNLTFENEEWAKWFHAWLGRFMLTHRYFNADAFKIASLPLPPTPAAPPEPPQAIVAEVLEPKVEQAEATTPIEPEMPVKRKGGRKKKEVTNG